MKHLGNLRKLPEICNSKFPEISDDFPKHGNFPPLPRRLRIARFARFPSLRIARKYALHLVACTTFFKKSKKYVDFCSKRALSPAKNKILHEKYYLFTEKTTHPPKKLNFCMKNDKIDQKDHPAAQKTWHFAWKIKNRPTYGDFKIFPTTPNFNTFLNP